MTDTKHRVRLFKRDRKLNICYIFGCDDTCNLDVVKTLLSDLKEKHGIAILAFKNHFGLAQSSEMCESIIPDLPMDFAIFVVHANGNRLSINEDIAGFGYAKIYRALLKATGDRVIVVITGDNNYKNSAEEQSAVLSRWAWEKMYLQFNVEFLDGRKSFIFSWDKEHRPIHEEAMMHFLDPDKQGERFFPKPKVEPTVVVEDPKKTVKCQETVKTDSKATKNKQYSSDIQAQTSEDIKHKMEVDSSTVDVPNPEEKVKEENVKCFRLFNCDKTYGLDVVETLLNDIKAKLAFTISIQEHYFDLRNMSKVCDKINKKELQMDFAIFVVHAHESRLLINKDNGGIGYAKLYRALLQATDGRVLIVIGGDDNYKDSVEEQSTVLSHWTRRKVSFQFDDELMDGRKSFIFSWDKEHRPIHEEAMLHFFDKKGEIFVPKPKATVASENPKTVASQEIGVRKTQSRRVQEEVSMQYPFQRDEPEAHGIEFLPFPHEQQGTEETDMDTSDAPFVLVEKKDPCWEEGDTRTQLQLDTVARPINPDELVLHTRLRQGMISYDDNDVKVRLEGWTAPQMMVDHLLKEFQSIANLELLVYREIETGNERTVVNKDITSQLSGLGHSFKGALEGVVRSSVVGTSGAYVIGSTIGSTIGLYRRRNTSPSKSETDTPPSYNETGNLPGDL